MYSLVIPVYKNEDSIFDLVAAVEQLSHKVKGEFEAIFVVDGSPDKSADHLQSLLADRPFAARLVLLSRNFGSFAAIRVGLEHARGRYIAVMAADLQEPPELVLEFFETLATEEYDVVVGTRESRADPLMSRLSSKLFWSAYRRFVMPQMPSGGVDIFGCNENFRDYVLKFEETNTSLVGILFWLGFRRKHIAYTRRRRMYGKSAWTFSKKVKYFMDSVFAFTDLPVRALMAAGILGLVVSTTLGLIVLIARLADWLVVPGYAATALMVLFFGGINTLGLGLIGSYAWRAYENTKRRPLATTLRTLDYPAGTEGP